MRLLAAILLILIAGTAPAQQHVGQSVLIYSGTTWYRHESIPAGVEALRKLAAERGLAVEPTEDPSVFAPDRLRRFKVIVLLSSTTDPKDPGSEWLTGSRRDALRQFVSSGGSVLAVHAAADSHYHWPWYGKLIGGRFARHPEGTPKGTVSVVSPAHPATSGLPATVERVDEWYYFDDYDPTSALLVTLDPASIGEADVNPNPVSWARQVDDGRVFYTAMGHTSESYSEPYFLDHLGAALDWLIAPAAERR